MDGRALALIDFGLGVELMEFGRIRRRQLLSPILVDHLRLIREERASSGVAKDFRAGGDGVAGGGGGNGKYVATLLAPSERFRQQSGGLRARDAADGRSEGGDAGGVLLE